MEGDGKGALSMSRRQGTLPHHCGEVGEMRERQGEAGKGREGVCRCCCQEEEESEGASSVIVVVVVVASLP